MTTLSWKITLTALSAIAQFGALWVGWLVTNAKQRLTNDQRKGFTRWFLLCGITGIAATVTLSFLPQQQERAHFSIAFGNKYKFDDVPPDRWPYFLSVDRPLAFNVGYKNEGNGTSFNTWVTARSSIQDDVSDASQKKAISDYEQWLTTATPFSETLAREAKKYITAYGPKVSPEDFNNLAAGRRVAFLVGHISFSDDFGTHVQRFCQFVQPPIPPIQYGDAETFHGCGRFEYNDEK